MMLLDSVVVERYGMPFRIDLAKDRFNHPRDFEDRFTPADEANYDDGWQFVRVSVTPLGHEGRFTEFDGIEYGESLRWRVTLDDLVERGDDEGWFHEAYANLVAAIYRWMDHTDSPPPFATAGTAPEKGSWS